MYTIVLEASTTFDRIFRKAAERFHKESVRSFTVSTSVGECVAVVAVSVHAKSENTTYDRV